MKMPARLRLGGLSPLRPLTLERNVMRTIALALLLAACGGSIETSSDLFEQEPAREQNELPSPPAANPAPSAEPDPDLEVPQETTTPVDEPEDEPEPAACVAEPLEPLPGSGGRAKPCGKVRDACGELQDYGACFGEDLCGGDGLPNVCGVCRTVEGDGLVASACQLGAFTGCDPRAYAQFGCDPITLVGDDGIARLYLCCNCWLGRC
jgi:hypothetical protein